MRKWLILLVILSSTTAFAQDSEPGFFGRLFGGGEAADAEEDPGGFLENLIEENLSGEGRQVEIIGFEGLLGGRATLETMTISDTDGVWFRMRDVTLDWSRTALLRGRIEVSELSAEVIQLPRLPLPAEETAPSPEASGFSLPELPVSVELGRIGAQRVEIGQPVFGVETAASVEGSLSLAGGEGSANLMIDRLNGDGSLALDASYSNETEVLALDLSLDEAANGIVVSLLDLPGRPALSFTIVGEDPISAFGADIRLATDGAERLRGRITSGTPADVPGASTRIAADIRGDIAPLFLPDYQTFFGDDVALVSQITTFEDGRLSLEDLTLRSASLALTGQVDIGSDRLPERIDVEGAIAQASGSAVLLPLAGPETRVDRVDLDIGFDAAVSDDWSGTFEISGLDRPGFSAESLALNGTGQISGGVGDASVAARLGIEATRLDLGNEDAAEALGETVTGGANINWSTGAPIQLTNLEVAGESYLLNGRATLRTSDDGLDVEGQVFANAEDLSVFSGIAQRTLGGSAAVETGFMAQPLAGFFDVTVAGSTTDLIVSQPEADRILAGEVQLEASASRDENGVRLTLTTLESPNASIVGQANLRTDASTLSVSANLADAALVLPDISGPVRLTASAEQDEARWQWQANAGLEGSTLEAEGSALDLFGTPIIDAAGSVSVDDLAAFAALAKREIGGAVEARFSGDIVTDLSRASLSLEGTTTDLIVEQEQADILMQGVVDVSFDAAIAGDVMSLRNLVIDGTNLSLNADGTIAPEVGSVTASGQISSAALLLEGAPEGALNFAGETRLNGRDWNFEAKVEGPDFDLSTNGVALDPIGPAAAIEGQVEARAANLSIFSELANRPLAGSLEITAEGGSSLDFERFDLNAVVGGNGLAIGQAQADRLLAGPLALALDASRNGGAIDLSLFDLTTGLLDVDASGTLGVDESSINLDARLANLAAFVSGFDGPLSITGSIGQDGLDADFRPDLTATGPAGTRATLRGGVAPDFSTVNVDVDGVLPLGLINQFIQPRSIAGTAGFDLSVNGPPALGSVSGVITTSGTRFVAPALGITLNDISGNVTLAGSRAQVSITGAPEAGGQLFVEGPIGLTPPLNSDLTIRLASFGLTDPRLYETVLDGAITLTGPLQGGARIGGTLALGETNIRIPSSGIGGSGAIPEILHINEPPPVRGTRSRAGLLDTGGGDQGDAGPGFPLDIRISAPNQVFVRGRGLDSEFGGTLRVTGSTNDVVPIGAFNLIRGRLDILGQRLEIEEATITLQGSFVPVLRIVATTQSDEFNINVIVSGQASNPEISFTSAPELPEEEVLSRLLFGRGLDTLSPLQAARLALAVRTLAGQGGEGIVGNIREGTGLADFDVTTDDEGNTEVRAGAYLSENIYTDVTVDGGGETRLNLNLDLTPSVTVKGSASNEGDTSVGIFFERDY